MCMDVVGEDTRETGRPEAFGYVESGFTESDEADREFLTHRSSFFVDVAHTEFCQSGAQSVHVQAKRAGF